MRGAGAAVRGQTGSRVRPGTAGPAGGFGKVWHKSYTLSLGDEVAPHDALAAWQAGLPGRGAPGGWLTAALGGLTPADIALLGTCGGGVTLSTGVAVLYSDRESCTLASPPRHLLAAWVTVAAERSGGQTVIRAQVLMRASDPLGELFLACGGHGREDRWWMDGLTALAARLGAAAGPAQVEVRGICLDSRRQWQYARNVWRGPTLRAALHAAATPLARARARGSRAGARALPLTQMFQKREGG